MLNNFFILQHLPGHLFSELEQHCPIKRFEPKEAIIKEGDRTTDIYFPISGRLEYYKYDEGLKQEIKFLELEADSNFSVGEMAFVDSEPRSCSVYAAADNEVTAYILSFADLEQNSPLSDEIKSAIRHQVTLQINNHLRQLNVQHINTLKEQVSQLEEQNYFGSLFIGVATIIGIISLVNQSIKEIFPEYTIGATPTASWVFVALATIPALLMVIKHKIPLADLGVGTHNLLASLKDGIISIVGIMALVFAILWGIQLYAPETELVSKFIHLLTSINLIASLHYLPNSYLQEFVTRGIAQTAIQHFFNDRQGYSAVLVTSMFFAIGHTPFGLVAVAVTFIGSIFLGFIYLRSRNLLGVSLIHYFFGGVLFSAGML